MVNYVEKSKRLALISIALVGILSIISGSLSCSQAGYSRKVETVTIAQTPNETNSLIYIAGERGFFAANDLNIVLQDYDSGVTATNALLKDEVDLATCAEFVIVGNVLKKESIRNIACIDKFQNTYIIGRADKGISGVADLKGKRIGVTRQTSDEFYLGRFLELHGMSIQQVTLVSVTRAQSVDDLVSGSVDAVAVIQP